ncbi:MAG TPA: ABC transporter permease subunit [Devosia sp.]|nr:ABC transporter permease subunit [Devosia sp.]
MTDLVYSAGFRTLVYQIMIVAAILLAGFYLYANVTHNLQAQSIATGYRFLNEVSQFEIGEKLIAYSSRSTYFDALVVGLLNTLYVSFFGVILATILGFSVGISRVSGNWLLMKVATAYVEFVRNIPVILQVIFWVAVTRNLPAPRQALEVFGVGFLSNRGLTFAVPVGNPVHVWMLMACGVGIVLCFFAKYWARKHRERTGNYIETLWIYLGLVAGLPLLVWLFAGAPLQISFPERQGFNFIGGASVSPEFVALLLGIAIYSSSYIAEIVRAGIQATPKGQIEAARSISLKPSFITRYVVLPQALRMIVPPLTSQYVSLFKNSSIAVVVGYPDLVNIGNTVMNQTGQAVEAIVIMMIVYLAISITTSLLMNFYNRVVAIKER